MFNTFRSLSLSQWMPAVIMYLVKMHLRWHHATSMWWISWYSATVMYLYVWKCLQMSVPMLPPTHVFTAPVLQTFTADCTIMNRTGNVKLTHLRQRLSIQPRTSVGSGVQCRLACARMQGWCDCHDSASNTDGPEMKQDETKQRREEIGKNEVTISRWVWSRLELGITSGIFYMRVHG